MNKGNIIVQIGLDLLDKWNKYQCSEIKPNVIRCNNGQLTFVKHTDGNSWCAAFVSTVISIFNDSYPNDPINIKLTASTYEMYNSAKQNGYIIDKNPQVGDIFYRKYSNSYCKSTGSAANCGHVGIVYKVDIINNLVYTIEGNVNNKIDIIKHKYDEFITGTINVPEGHFLIHLDPINYNQNSNVNNYLFIKQRNYYL